MIISLIITIIVLLCVDWSKFDYGSQFLSKGRKVSSGNLETNQLFERRPKEEEESTELLLDDRIVKLSKASIIGQSTFGMKETEGGEFEELQIRDASKAVGEVLSNLKDKTEVDLLHVNCEGCEWEMFENLISSGIHTKIRMIQFGSHYFSQVEGITQRYCQIRDRLSETHHMLYGEAWGWERWDRR